MTEKIAGTIGTTKDRAPRRRLTLAQRVQEIDVKIERAQALVHRLVERRSRMVTEAKVAAEARLAEAEQIK